MKKTEMFLTVFLLISCRAYGVLPLPNQAAFEIAEERGIDQRVEKRVKRLNRISKDLGVYRKAVEELCKPENKNKRYGQFKPICVRKNILKLVVELNDIFDSAHDSKSMQMRCDTLIDLCSETIDNNRK